MKRIILPIVIIIFLLGGCGEKAVKTTGECSLLVTCEKALASDSLAMEKRDVLPMDGVILTAESALIFEGDTVFDVVERILRENKIQVEFSKTQVYDSVYIEGISNLYQKDVGDMSGWLFKVNGEMPALSMSKIEVKDKDIIELYYSTDFMEDMN